MTPTPGQVQVRTGTREFVKNAGYEDFMRAQMPAQVRDADSASTLGLTV